MLRISCHAIASRVDRTQALTLQASAHSFVADLHALLPELADNPWPTVASIARIRRVRRSTECQ